MLSKVCNHKDQYAITHACSETLKSSRDAVSFAMGANFRRKVRSYQEFIFEEEGLFKIFENKFPLKITCYSTISRFLMSVQPNGSQVQFIDA